MLSNVILKCGDRGGSAGKTRNEGRLSASDDGLAHGPASKHLRAYARLADLSDDQFVAGTIVKSMSYATGGGGRYQKTENTR